MQNDSIDGSTELTTPAISSIQVNPELTLDFSTKQIEPEQVQSRQDDNPQEAAALLDNAYDTLPNSQTSENEANSQIFAYFGDYELLSEIARGGMGVCFAKHEPM